MACRAVLCSSSHSYCPSLLYFSPSLFSVLCLSRFGLWVSHLSLNFLCFFFCSFLHSSCSISVSFSLPAPSCSLFLSIHYLSFSHIQALSPSHTLLVSLSLSRSMLHPLSPSLSLSVGGVTVLGRPPRGARLPQLLHVGRRERPLHQLGWPPLRLHCAVRGTERATRGQMLQEDL